MSVKLIKSSPEEAVFTVKIDADTIEKAIMEAFLKVSAGQDVNKGLPLSNRAMLAQHPQLEQIASQGLDNILPPYYMKALKELGLQPITFPEVRPQRTVLGEPCVVEFRVSLEPQISLKQYEGLETCYAEVVASEEDVARQLDAIRQSRGATDDAMLLEKLPFDTIDAFVAEIRSSLQSMAEEKTQENKKEAVLKKLTEMNPCPVREDVVEQQVMLMINQFRQQVGARNFDDYLKSTGKSIDQAKKEARPEAEAAIRKNLLLGAVADTLALTVAEEELKTAVMKRNSSIMDFNQGYEERLKRLSETPGALEQLQHSIRLEKATAYVVAKAKLTKSATLNVLDQLPGQP